MSNQWTCNRRGARTACRGFNLRVVNDLTEEADLHDNTKLYRPDQFNLLSLESLLQGVHCIKPDVVVGLFYNITTKHLAFIAQCYTNKHFIVCLGKTVHKRICYDCLSNKKWIKSGSWSTKVIQSLKTTTDKPFLVLLISCLQFLIND